MDMEQAARKAFFDATGGDDSLTAENLAAEMKDSFIELMNARVVRLGNKLILDFDEDDVYGVTFEKIG